MQSPHLWLYFLTNLSASGVSSVIISPISFILSINSFLLNSSPLKADRSSTSTFFQWLCRQLDSFQSFSCNFFFPIPATITPAPFRTPRITGFRVILAAIVPITIKHIPEITTVSSRSLYLLYDFLKHQYFL